MDRVRFLELVEAFREGAATEAEIGEITVMLRADASLRREFVEEMLLEGCLCDSSGRAHDKMLLDSEEYDSFSDVFSGRVVFRKVGPARSGGGRMWAAAAAAVALVGAGVLMFAGGDDSRTPHARVASGRLQVDGRAVDRILDGQEFSHFGERPVLLHPATGVSLEIAPGAVGTLQLGRGALEPALSVTAGSAVVHVERGSSVRLETAHAGVLSAGAVFTVRIEGTGVGARTVVSVDSGEVRLESTGAVRTLRAGDSASAGSR
jgi:hypothetical protein